MSRELKDEPSDNYVFCWFGEYVMLSGGNTNNWGKYRMGNFKEIENVLVKISVIEKHCPKDRYSV